ncbi:uncharacterized protein LOC129788096 [Lutzomyia longipalpis]|uniref:uncharacterized protein LOC129788096 n=1 Tax=Lutzomyia longipalpis TaxID=7200 RepID=UPI002483FC1A|nr:uncharacterized protein LOC129788096 [Lutzomyia longipalpis]
MEGGILGVKALFLFTIVCFKCANSIPTSSKVQILYSWKPFVYEDLPHSEYSKVDGNNYYISKNVLPTSVSYHDKTGCLILPIQRLHPGIPATINYINLNGVQKGSSPPLRGLPTYVDNYLPGWFGVNDLREDDYKYNIYPSDSKVKRQAHKEDANFNEDKREEQEYLDENQEKKSEEIKNSNDGEKKYQDKIIKEGDDEENKEVNEEEDEVRKKHGSHYKPSHNHGHYHGGSYVFHVPPSPIKTTTTTTTTTTPAPTYKPSYKPPYKPPPSPPKNPTRDVYHFVSVYFTDTDSDCDRLTFVDHGTLLYPDNEIFIRPPIIWAFDIYECSDEGFGYPPALKVTIPDNVVERPAGFCAFTVDNYNSCNEFAVYIANCFDNRIVVYDNVKRSFWYFAHDTFKPGAERSLYPGPLPPEDSYNFGIMSITGGAHLGNSYKEIYYSPGSSYGVFRTTTKVLRDKSLAPGSPTSPYFAFLGYGGIDSESIASFDSDSNVLFFIHLLSNTLQCWNINAPLVEGNVVTLFSDLEYGVDMLIDDNRNIQFLLYYGHGVPYWEADIPSNALYRLYSASIDDLIKGTACDPKYV